MKKLNLSLLTCFILALALPALAADDQKGETAAAQSEKAQLSAHSNTDAKYEIMRRDQIDTTDALAIQLDDSEVEDEEEVNLLEGKEVFDLPKAK